MLHQNDNTTVAIGSNSHWPRKCHVLHVQYIPGYHQPLVYMDALQRGYGNQCLPSGGTYSSGTRSTGHGVQEHMVLPTGFSMYSF